MEGIGLCCLGNVSKNGFFLVKVDLVCGGKRIKYIMFFFFKYVFIIEMDIWIYRWKNRGFNVDRFIKMISLGY